MTASSNECLLIIDTQRGLDDPSYGARSTPTAERNIARLLSAWRDASRPVLHVRHVSVRATSPLRPGTPGVDFKPEAQPIAGEAVYDKSTNSAFIGTTLEHDLRARGIGALVVAGLTTDHCVSSTVRTAADLGFAVTVVSDACATHERRGHDGLVVSAEDMHRSALASLSGEFAMVLDTDAVLAA
ncbi:MAG TPA: cysteine hydrolase family protein [Trueperaceae bacterium]|nr:cysteine hydrolase family protein [Trueperaceae bacterium]